MEKPCRFSRKFPRSRVFAVRRAKLLASLAVVCGSFAASADTLSFWTNSAAPGTPEVTDDTSAVTLGLPFYSETAGHVTGVRFYKGANNTGTHSGSLWSSGGTQLASVTFTRETASGWQEANFSSPVSISANTTYVIAYYAPNGSYADDQYYPWTSLKSAPLHVSGSTGVYAYGSGSTFPTETWNGSNYWVDVVFAPNSSGGPTVHSISGTVSGAAATLTLSGDASGSTKTDSAGRFSFPGLANGSYVIVPGQAGYTFSPATALAKINGADVTGVNFTAAAIPAHKAHSVSLSWSASASSNIAGYRLYRGTTASGPYGLVNGSLIAGTGYVDNNVSSGKTYYYVATAVDTNNVESGYSNESVAVVPTP